MNKQRKHMSDLTVNEARLVDVPAMVELLQQLFSQEQDFEPNPTRQAAALELILTHPNTGRLFVATRSARVQGMVSLLYTVSTATGGYAAWLEDLVVDRSIRSHGVGSALLDYVIAWAARRGVTRLTLLTDCDNESARRQYTRRGFTASHMVPLRLALR